MNYSRIFQNPLYMKEKFRLVIESLHLPDNGFQDNVSLIWCFLVSFCSWLVYVGGWWCWINKKKTLVHISLTTVVVAAAAC